MQKYFFFTTFHLKRVFSCKKLLESFVVNTKSATFALAKANMVRWMSGLVTGLQNRLHPFESGTHLQKARLAICLSALLFLWQ